MTSGTHVTFNQWQLMDEVFNLVTAGLDVAQETTAKKSAPAIKDLQYLAAHIEGSKLLEEVELCFLFSLLLMMMPRYLYISNVMTSSPRILLNPHRSTSKKLRIQWSKVAVRIGHNHKKMSENSSILLINLSFSPACYNILPGNLSFACTWQLDSTIILTCFYSLNAHKHTADNAHICERRPH